MNNHDSGFSVFRIQMIAVLLGVLLLVGCKTTQSSVKHDFSKGINISVSATSNNPAYRIADAVGIAGYGYAYLMQKSNGRWKVSYDSFDAKAFAKAVGGVTEIPEGSEVLWTDGAQIVAYFGSEPLMLNSKDGTFLCPKKKEEVSHRACRSAFANAKNFLDGFSNGKYYKPFMLDFEEIKKAVEDTGIVRIAKKRIALERR